MKKNKPIADTSDCAKICESCAKKRRMSIPSGHIASFWTDICDVCKEYKEVSDPQDFKYLTEDF